MFHDYFKTNKFGQNCMKAQMKYLLYCVRNTSKNISNLSYVMSTSIAMITIILKIFLFYTDFHERLDIINYAFQTPKSRY